MMDFPASPVEGQAFAGFIYRSGEWRRAKLRTALPRNLFVNPNMQISQQNGATASGPLSAINEYYTADQWCFRWSISPGQFNASRPAQRTPNGSADVSAVSCPIGKGVLAAGDYCILTQKIEGLRTADLQWGTANAQQVVVRFWSFCTTAGTYSFRLSNGDSTRSYVHQYTMPSNVWTMVTAAIPGDTTGIWANTSAISMWFDVSIAIGSTYTGTILDAWQAGNIYAGPGQTNGAIASTGNWFSDLGLYVDPYKTGVAPPWEPPDYAVELRRCQRYWYKAFTTRGTVSAATTVGRPCQPHPVPMRANPTSTTIAGAPQFWDGATTKVISAIASASNQWACEFDMTCAAATFVGGRAGGQFYSTDADYLAISARM